MTHPFNAVGVYIYAGGFSQGVKEHFNVLAHLEDGPFGKATVNHNMPEVQVFSHVPSWANDIDRFLTNRGNPPVHFVHSNPPCAPWSMGGKAVNGTRGLQDDDDRVECVYNSFEMFEYLRPTNGQHFAWAWESVARTATAGRAVIDDLARQANTYGYKCTIVIVDGRLCGVPQRRKRTFVLIHNFDIDWQSPQSLNYPTRVVRDAIGEGVPFDALTELAHMSQAERAMITDVLPGGSLRDHFNKVYDLPLVDPDRKIVRGRPAFSRRRVNMDEHSFTMIGGPHLFHPTEDRLLSVPECAAICGFPPEYKFVSKSVNDKYAQVAKGVMPPVAAWLALNVRAGLELGHDVSDLSTRIKDFTLGCRG